MTMKRGLFFIITLLIIWGTKAQELPLYSQYILNPYLINPAIAGIDGCGNIQAVSGIKWVGVRYSPQTYAVSYHQGFKKIGLGTYIFSDRNGFNSDLGFQMTFAYHLRLNKSSVAAKQLSFGISFCGNQHILDETKYSNDGFDPIVTGGKSSSFIPDANAGIYYISNRFFTGLSTANLFRTRNDIFKSDLEPVKYRFYFYQIGYTIQVKNAFVFEPSLTTKLSESTDKQMDANMKFIFDTRKHKKIWFAVSFRKNFNSGSFNSFTYMPLVGFNNSNFSFAYSYNYSIGVVSQKTMGSHEIMLGYHFCIKRKRIVTCPALRNFREQKEH